MNSLYSGFVILNGARHSHMDISLCQETKRGGEEEKRRRAKEEERGREQSVRIPPPTNTTSRSSFFSFFQSNTMSNKRTNSTSLKAQWSTKNSRPAFLEPLFASSGELPFLEVRKFTEAGCESICSLVSYLRRGSRSTRPSSSTQDLQGTSS